MSDLRLRIVVVMLLSAILAFAITAGAQAEIIVEPAPGVAELELVTEFDSYEADREIMAHLLCGECQSGSRELQEAVGSVVLNRVESDDFPDTIDGVVFQKGQYACTWD